MRLKTSNTACFLCRRGIPSDGVEFQLASISQSHLSVRREPFPPSPPGVFVLRTAIFQPKKTKNISRAFGRRRVSPLIKNSKRTCRNGGFLLSPSPPTDSAQFFYSRKPRARLRRRSFSTFNYFPVRLFVVHRSTYAESVETDGKQQINKRKQRRLLIENTFIVYCRGEKKASEKRHDNKNDREKYWNNNNRTRLLITISEP